jgi:hypothetical protein
MSSLSTDRAHHLATTGASTASAVTGGYHVAFLAAALAAALAAGLALAVLRPTPVSEPAAHVDEPVAAFD